MRSEYADGDADVVNSTLCASGVSGINWQCQDVFALCISSTLSMSANTPCCIWTHSLQCVCAAEDAVLMHVHIHGSRFLCINVYK